MNKHKVLLNIKNVDIRYLIKKLYNNNITIYKIDYVNKEEINIIVAIDDYYVIKESKDYIVTFVKHLGLYSIIDKIKKYKILSLSILLGIILVFIISNVIVKVNIIYNDQKLTDELRYELEDYGIKSLSFKKNYDEINKIKEKILTKYKDKIEWLEIENIGMTYVIRLEERIVNDYDKDNSICDVVAKKSGLIKSIYVEKGLKIKNVDNYVNKDDIIISGDIAFNNEIKNMVCANGEVYAEVWYEAKVNMPLRETNYQNSNHTRYNIMLEKVSKSNKIFRSKYKYYEEEKSFLFSFFNTNIYLVKEHELIATTKVLSEKEALEKGIQKAIDNINIRLNKKEHIITKKVLKNRVNDSTMNIDIFISVYENIASVKIR